MLNVDEDAVFAAGFQELKVVGEELGGRFCDQDVVAAFDGVHGDRKVCCIRGEDRDGAALGKRINSGFVGIGIGLIVGREGKEARVEVVVYLRNVLL